MGALKDCLMRPSVKSVQSVAYQSQAETALLQNFAKPGLIKSRRIGFPTRRVGTFVVGNNVANGIPRRDGFDETAQRQKLRLGKRILSVVPVHQFNTDREIVDVGASIFHPGFPGVPGAILFRHMRNDSPVTVDGVMGRDVRFRTGKMVDDFVHGFEYGRMHDDRIDVHSRGPFVKIRRWMAFNLQSVVACFFRKVPFSNSWNAV